MSTFYKVAKSRERKDLFANLLNEADSYFKNELNTSIIGRDFLDIIGEEAQYNEYKSHLMSEVDENDKENLDVLFDSARADILNESSINFSPVYSLTFPILRNLWPAISLKNAIPTEAVERMAFTISFMKPFLYDENNTKYYLPEALLNDTALQEKTNGVKLYDGVIYLADFTPTGASAQVDGAAKGFDLLESLAGGVVASRSIGDSVDRDLTVVSIVANNGTEGTFEIPVNKKINASGLLAHKIENYYRPDQYGTDGTVLVGQTPFNAQVFVIVDFSDSKLNVTSSNAAVAGVKIDGKLNPEFNNHSMSVSFENQNKEITIGNGSHINAPMTDEMIKDGLAMFNINATTKLVETLSKIVQLNVDLDIKKFFVSKMNAARYQGTFNCQPSANFLAGPTAWFEQIKRVIEQLATAIEQDNYFSNGHFVIVGHKNDVNIISGINWVFDGNSTTKSGITVNYKLGAMSGTQNYTIISSPVWERGKLFMFYVPADADVLTYKYYPYTFGVHQNAGYRDPNRPNVPSMVIMKRHTLESFHENCAAVINILNNNFQSNV